MTLTWLLATTCSILALGGCGRTESPPPAGGNPPADTAGAKPANEATRPADDVLKSPPPSDKADVKDAEPGPVATSETPTIKDTSGPLLVTANERRRMRSSRRYSRVSRRSARRSKPLLTTS